jgi:hypothetical protein
VRYRLFFVALATAIVLLAQGPIEAQAAAGNVPQISACTVQKDEIEVFVGFLKLNTIPHGSIVLVTTTEATDGNVDKFSDMFHATKGYTIPNELREDFKSKNKSSCTITAFHGIKNLSFVSETELARPGEIQKRYGQDALLITFSRVGFNSDRTFAFLHVSLGVDISPGAGTLYLLKRRGQTWAITLKVETTLSPKTVQP